MHSSPYPVFKAIPTLKSSSGHRCRKIHKNDTASKLENGPTFGSLSQTGCKGSNLQDMHSLPYDFSESGHRCRKIHKNDTTSNFENSPTFGSLSQTEHSISFTNQQISRTILQPKMTKISSVSAFSCSQDGQHPPTPAYQGERAQRWFS